MSVSPALLDPRRSDVCTGTSHTAILVTYAAPQGRADAEGDHVPLRCGRPDQGRQVGWGYRHFATRWIEVAEQFHRDLQATLGLGRRRRRDRATVQYDLAWIDAPAGPWKAMTVVMSLRAQQPDGGIRGIVTAYWWDHPERALGLPAASQVAGD